jgi:hypothetical protein
MLLDLGTFICKDCADIHRRLIEHCHPPRFITSRDLLQQQQAGGDGDEQMQWDNELIQRLEALGNAKVNLQYEATVPVSYRRPTPTDPLMVREEWILSKYVRRDFTLQAQPRHDDVSITGCQASRCMTSPTNAYQQEYKEGFLWKRAKNKDCFNRRLFVVDGKENTLRYYIKDQSERQPKNTFRLNDVNLVLVPDKVGQPYSMQIVCETGMDKRRHIFAYAESGKELIEWYSCVRWLKLKRLPEFYRIKNPNEVCAKLTHDFVKEGWMWKTGPNSSDAFRRRWFTLDVNTLLYSKQPLDPEPHCIHLGSGRKGYDIIIAVPEGFRRPTSGFAFTLVTPRRQYCLSTETLDEREDWMKWLRAVVGTYSEFSN